ncbi:DUF485 domain-containing protein [Burkholderia plantarii]|uniref:DUF485 domain-containing protein n=1 Tax=Burkholderia plantarii TaxID=41899 RepID=UPI00272AD3D5|nr:DUF485 domain-containing protein [Burkholderia plantarii]
MTEMSHEHNEWRDVLANSQFRTIAIKRRNAIVAVGAFAAAYYFAIPAVIAWAPALFTIRLTGGFNLGVAFAISQYPVGGLLCWVFMRSMARLDRERQAFLSGRGTGSDAREMSHAQ